VIDLDADHAVGNVKHPDRVVETHVHYWDHSRPDLSWPFLAPGNEWGYDAIDAPSYLPVDFGEDVGATNVIQVVHEQCGALTDALIETDFISSIVPAPDALIAGCSLAAEGSAALIEAHATSPLFRGIRDATANGELLSSPSLSVGLRALAAVDGTCELLVRFSDFPLVSRLAEANPDVTFVLGHAGSPVARTTDYWRSWSAALRRLAVQGNVVCKVSGLTGRDPHWTVASLRPWVLSCIESFGPRRTMFGGNWPPARLRGQYTEIVLAHAAILSSLPEGDRDWFFARTAQTTFRLDAGDEAGTAGLDLL
jgi:predicted TIM-barrel fold metal-dependent hydrolase